MGKQVGGRFSSWSLCLFCKTVEKNFCYIRQVVCNRTIISTNERKRGIHTKKKSLESRSPLIWMLIEIQGYYYCILICCFIARMNMTSVYYVLLPKKLWYFLWPETICVCLLWNTLTQSSLSQALSFTFRLIILEGKRLDFMIDTDISFLKKIPTWCRWLSHRFEVWNLLK